MIWSIPVRRTKASGSRLNIPLRNRDAQANQVRAELEYRQAQMRLQQIENQIRIEVRNAQFTLQQNRASVAAAQAAVALGPSVARCGTEEIKSGRFHQHAGFAEPVRFGD